MASISGVHDVSEASTDFNGFNSDEELSIGLPTPANGTEYSSREALIRGLQDFAEPHGYAFIIKRSFPFKNGRHSGSISCR